MKVLSLFDGISCARVALQKVGIPVETYFASEIDKYAIEVTQKNHYQTVQLGDVKKVDKYVVGEIDLLIGGSPCQDLSIAKKNRKGLSGERSGLFWEYVRILQDVKPKYFILENVASMPKEAKAQISEILGVEPIMINAGLVSAQNRRRLFWTNIPEVGQPADQMISITDTIETHLNITIEYRNRTAEKWRVNKSGKVQTLRSAMGTGGNNIPYVVTDKEILFDEVSVENAAELYKASKLRKLTPIECERLQCLPDNYTEGISNTQRYKCLGNAFNVDVIAHLLSKIKQEYV